MKFLKILVAALFCEVFFWAEKHRPRSGTKGAALAIPVTAIIGRILGVSMG